jgi:hypothetical protein
MAAFVMACIVKNHAAGQVLIVLKKFDLKLKSKFTENYRKQHFREIHPMETLSIIV